MKVNKLLCKKKKKETGADQIWDFPSLSGFVQVYTRSVIDPLPAPDGDAASKAADKQKKKGGKMTDEEIMEKLSKETKDRCSV